MLSIDVGFGNTKVYDGENVFGFPSVYMEANKDYQLKTDPNEKLLELDGVLYHVGRTALNKDGLAPFDREDILRHKIFMLTAICSATKGKDFSDEVALGLPIGDFSAIFSELKKLKGTYDVKYNEKKVHIEVTKVKVFKQSEAIFNLLKKENKSLTDRVVGIIDVGQKTVDFAYFVDGSYVEKRSGSMEQGVINAYQDIADAVNTKLGFEVEDYKAKKYIPKVQDDADKAFEKLSEAIRNRLKRKKWNFEEIEDVYVVGGGASYISPFFKDTAYKPLDEMKAVFANAYGYYEEA